jgi:hypothetical protein
MAQSDGARQGAMLHASAPKADAPVNQPASTLAAEEVEVDHSLIRATSKRPGGPVV